MKKFYYIDICLKLDSEEFWIYIQFVQTSEKTYKAYIIVIYG